MKKHQIKLIKYITGALLVLPLWVTGQNIVWEQTYAIPDDQSIVALSETDTGYLAFGQGENVLEFAEVLKIDTIGQLLWRKPIFSDTAISRSYSFDMTKVPEEENYYVAGFFRRNGPVDYVVKINAQADTLWSYLYQPLNAIFRTTEKIITLKDKSVITVGFQEQAGPQENIFVRRIDSTGQLMWDEIYSLPGNQRGYDITEMMDGSLIVAGSSDGDNIVLRIGFDGRLIDTMTVPTINGNVVFQDAVTMPGNNLGLGIVSRQGTTTNIGQYLYFDTALNVLINSPQEQGVYDGPIVLKDSSLIINNYRSNDSLYIRNLDFSASNTIWQTSYGKVPNAIKLMETYTLDNTSLIIAGYDDTGADQDYWLAKIDGVGEEWIQDPCAFSPPVAGFAYNFNGGIFTLLDTSYAGLPYLDTIYTWDWTLSNGFTSNVETPVTLLDTSSTKTLDIQLIVSNWYGCKDTINQTLNFGPTGITSDIQFEEKVWPNPVRDVLNISLSERPHQNVLFEVFDVHGRKQLQNSFSGKEGNLNISTLASGIYFYKLNSGGVVKRGKVVKE